MCHCFASFLNTVFFAKREKTPRRGYRRGVVKTWGFPHLAFPPELAPCSSKAGCRGFIGPFPPPLLIRFAVVMDQCPGIIIEALPCPVKGNFHLFRTKFGLFCPGGPSLPLEGKCGIMIFYDPGRAVCLSADVGLGWFSRYPTVFRLVFCLRRVTFLAEEKSPKVRLEPTVLRIPLS